MTPAGVGIVQDATTGSLDSGAMTEINGIARLAMVTIDCPDAEAEARFWAELLGGELQHAERDYGMVAASGVTIGFGRSEDFQPPAWPDHDGRKQFHFDLAVADIDAAASRAVELGATLPDHQPAVQEGGTWRVLLDPAGHPFCLTDEKNWD
jgi:predicted enzyme related to lactoylglutathione lyase